MFIIFILGLSTIVTGQDKAISVQELGQVNWLRSYEQATAIAEQTGKPIFILFQEVPGCATCRNYGDQVLSHPLIVDAIENEFVPLAIFNNKGGEDKKVLEMYGEPTWNNPVVRIVNQAGKDIMKRHAGNYSAEGLVRYMTLGLQAAGRGEPGYLSLLKEELSAANTETAYYKMYCFWSGESHLGAKEGVVSTEPGWMSGHEVVKVVFDKDQLKKKELDQYATKANCQPLAPASGYRVDKDPQYYLKKSPYRFLALSDIQKSKINAALAQGKDPKSLLSPTQAAYLATKESKEVLYDQSLSEAWNQMKGITN